MALITHWLIQTLIGGKALLQWHSENQEKEQTTHANSQRLLKIYADKETGNRELFREANPHL